MSKEDPFGVGAKEGRPEPKRDRWGRYVLTHPVTGKEQPWMRATTFTKMASDTYNLQQWAGRNIAKGLSLRPDLLALVATMDIAKDSKRLNEVCEEAKTAAGAKVAANTGTALHAFTETADGASVQDVPEMYAPRIAEYRRELERYGIQVFPELIERITVSTTYNVAGTFDRIVKLSDGSWVIFDLKTGRDLTYGQKEIEVQLALYADGVNEHGLWNQAGGAWEPTTGVRTDIGIVCHMPAQGSGCTFYTMDLERGRRNAEVCKTVRASRDEKVSLVPYEPPGGVTAAPAPASDRPSETQLEATKWSLAVEVSETRTELLDVVARCREAGKWTQDLADQARRKNLLLPD